jgi:hypothetical protein
MGRGSNTVLSHYRFLPQNQTHWIGKSLTGHTAQAKYRHLILVLSLFAPGNATYYWRLNQGLSNPLCWLYHKVVRQLEVHNRLHRYPHISIAGQSRGSSSSTITHQSAQHQPSASGGQSTHQPCLARTSESHVNDSVLDSVPSYLEQDIRPRLKEESLELLWS